jgi:dissimilatory sulfite reductase (desulfoviridin) alpha/beta subunit
LHKAIKSQDCATLQTTFNKPESQQQSGLAIKKLKEIAEIINNNGGGVIDCAKMQGIELTQFSFELAD